VIRQFLRSALVPTVPATTAEELAGELADGSDVQIVDVRDLSEWRAGHIPGARHIPLGELEHRLAELDDQRPVVLVCLSGSRSARATNALLRAGFHDVRNLDRGMVGWVRAGQPVRR
jgi:rhodanese-related sulfurtransferase